MTDLLSAINLIVGFVTGLIGLFFKYILEIALLVGIFYLWAKRKRIRAKWLEWRNKYASP